MSVAASIVPIEAEGDEDRLLSEARAGDRRALEALLRAHYDQIHAVCRRLLGNDVDAADAAQEALVAIVRGLPRFDRRSRLSTWIYRVAFNAAVDELRRRTRREGMSLEQLPERAAAHSTGSDAVVDGVDLDAALQRLPVEFRGPVVLRDLCGLDYREIGEVLHLPPGTVRSRIARGRAALVVLLSPAGSET